MKEPIDESFVAALTCLEAGSRPPAAAGGPERDELAADLGRLFEAQVQSRHLDFAARWLQQHGHGYYTIGSAGHESNAALGLLSRPDDPALLHYRSGGFYAARAAKAGGTRPIHDVLLSLACRPTDPMSGGRHKVFGHRQLHIIPQTSTIASHLPRAVGLAFALDVAAGHGRSTPWSPDAVVLCSFGDASANHSTALGALNAAAYMAHRGVPCPVLLVCEDNRIGISTPSPVGWPDAGLRALPGITYAVADNDDPVGLLSTVRQSLEEVRRTRRPGVLHLKVVRFMGHAGSDAELAYRSRSAIAADYARDPLLATARELVARGIFDATTLLARYESMRREVSSAAAEVLELTPLRGRDAVTAPLALPDRTPRPVSPDPARRSSSWADRLPETKGPMTLAQTINTTLTDLVDTHDEILVLGEDVAAKGGVYGVTRGLRKRFGGTRVFDTLLDEQTILGLSLGSALAGYLPIPEIQYLAYLHNAEDQLRGEAASLRFFSNGQYHNGMVVRIAGLGYQKGFGGHFHNDNSVAVLRDIPGIVLAAPSHPSDAAGMLRSCVALAKDDGRVCVFLEPIALYHSRDLHVPGDGLWTAPYTPPPAAVPPGEIRTYAGGADILLATFGNGVVLSLRAARRLAELGIAATVVDLRWLVPLPVEQLTVTAATYPGVLVVDETRASGGVSEAVVTGLVESGYLGRIGRVCSADSFVPLGPAAADVLLSEEQIVEGALHVLDVSRSEREE